MYWVLQNDIFNEEGFQGFVQALERRGLPHSLHKVIPFVGTLEPEVNPPEGKVIVIGTYTLARVAQERGWLPGSFLGENLDYSIQLKHWGNRMLNADAWIGPVKDVPEHTKPFFIRPVADSKAFSGFVTDWGEFSVWLEREQRQSKMFEHHADDEFFSENTIVMVATTKTIYQEYRTWIVDGKVVTASLYKSGGHKYARPQVDERIVHFAQETATLWSPLRAYVLDIAVIPAEDDNFDQLRVIEVNNLNSAGFYAGDMGKVVNALEDAFG